MSLQGSTIPWDNLPTNFQLTYDPSLPVTLCSSFSTHLATAGPNGDGFAVDDSPFDIEALQSTNVYFSKHDGSKGMQYSATTSRSTRSDSSLDLSLGVSVGNKYAGIGVSGAYQKSLLNAGSTDSSTRRAAFQAGTIRLQHVPSLSQNALELLAAESETALPAFRRKYGDYYVSGLTIGGEAAVTVMQETEQHESLEKLKAKAEAHFLCFSKEVTIAEKDIFSASTGFQLGIVAFDSLTLHHCDLSLKDGLGLKLSEAREVALLFNEFVETMPKRVFDGLAGWPALFEHGARLLEREVSAIMRSGLVTHLILSPWNTHREVRPFTIVA